MKGTNRPTIAMMSLIKKTIDLFNLRRDWLGAGGEPVALDVAQRRADTCLGCPNNQEKPIYSLFAGPIATTILRQLKLKRELGLRVKNEECLHICDACGCVLKLKVQAPLKFILENTDTKTLPDFCWIKSEQRAELFNSQAPHYQKVLDDQSQKKDK